MAEEILEQEQQEATKIPPEDQNLLEEVKKLKENTVSKEEYERLLKRNKELTQNWMQQTPAEKQDDPDTIESLRKELYSDDRKDMTNLEATQKILKLRSKVIEAGGKDPFLSTDANSEEEISTAERVAEGLQSMVDEADGNSAYFNALMQKVDATMPARRINNRR